MTEAGEKEREAAYRRSLQTLNERDLCALLAVENDALLDAMIRGQILPDQIQRARKVHLLSLELSQRFAEPLENRPYEARPDEQVLFRDRRYEFVLAVQFTKPGVLQITGRGAHMCITRCIGRLVEIWAVEAQDAQETPT